MILPSQARILLLGDSLSARGTTVSYEVASRDLSRGRSPGDLLASYLLGAGAASVHINAKVGRSAASFLAREDGLVILAREFARRPTLGVVFLGTNDAVSPSGAKKNFYRIHDAFFAAGIPVIAIGPPAFSSSARSSEGAPMEKGRRAITRDLSEVFGPARFLDAAPLTSDLLTVEQGRRADLIHFSNLGARLFAERLGAALTGVRAPRSRTSLRRPLLPLLGAGLLAYWLWKNA